MGSADINFGFSFADLCDCPEPPCPDCCGVECHVACPGITIPTTLHVTLSDFDGCSGLDGLTFPIEWDAGKSSWEGGKLCGGEWFGVSLRCDVDGLSVFVCEDQETCENGPLNSWSEPSCSPFFRQVLADAPFTSDCCPGGTGAFLSYIVTITE